MSSLIEDQQTIDQSITGYQERKGPSSPDDMVEVLHKLAISPVETDAIDPVEDAKFVRRLEQAVQEYVRENKSDLQSFNHAVKILEQWRTGDQKEKGNLVRKIKLGLFGVKIYNLLSGLRVGGSPNSEIIEKVVTWSNETFPSKERSRF